MTAAPSKEQIERWARDGTPADHMYAHQFRRAVANMALAPRSREEQPAEALLREIAALPRVYDGTVWLEPCLVARIDAHLKESGE